ncbi:MAG: glycoside hydrolase family 47 protein [Rhizobacter sp.]|nr:glycoside hydrolase family 47 protein [Ferruginibacter sp.]
MNKIFLFSFLCMTCCINGQAQPQAAFTLAMKDEMITKVKGAASHAWAGYMAHAWKMDDLEPLTKKGKNWYKHSMLMTAVDAFDSFVMMGLTEEAEQAKDLIFTAVHYDIDNEVQVFEVTIRVLAGLITAYEKEGNPIFLKLAKDLGDRMMPAFNTPTGMPYRYVNLRTGRIRDSINNPAEIGTLMMEFGQLSRHTGNNKYYAAAKKAIMAVYNKRSRIGLAGEGINVVTGKWTSTRSHISGYIDSYYEYLYKSWLLFGDKDFKKAFKVHNSSLKKYLPVNTANGTFMRVVDMNTGKQLATTYGALDAFYAGLCAFAGDVKTAKPIQEANYYMWTKFGLEPEEFDFSNDSIRSASYILRPENIESCFYLYRKTKDDKYLWMGKRMVDDIIQYCKTGDAYASLKDVVTKEKANSMQSFFFAETLKYAYLLFAEETAFNLQKEVFNTEAHPFKIIESKKQ